MSELFQAETRGVHRNIPMKWNWKILIFTHIENLM
jgi:hypothetical protein